MPFHLVKGEGRLVEYCLANTQLQAKFAFHQEIDTSCLVAYIYEIILNEDK